ncbi:hypothetical protein CN157_05070 [Sinorhizobium meliloti]|uniref:hypothetical protein n=1 Tax=Rhizobium meliloti TaxID=382 RepID=UPI000FD8D706|nr:hypothetical protein [Sinorhizobium meliloti]RVK81391.1 hypothetical protein CN157_05070 [Sinorhizobium meliloti]RVQ78013.1 hypothetical protein CN061_06975 [Sinorhizobium meliloti]
MTLHRYTYHVVRSAYDVLVTLTALAVSIVLAAVRYGASVTWHSLHSFGLVAFRVVGLLKPIYRESYETDGLIFSADRMRC